MSLCCLSLLSFERLGGSSWRKVWLRLGALQGGPEFLSRPLCGRFALATWHRRRTATLPSNIMARAELPYTHAAQCTKDFGLCNCYRARVDVHGDHQDRRTWLHPTICGRASRSKAQQCSPKDHGWPDQVIVCLVVYKSFFRKNNVFLFSIVSVLNVPDNKVDRFGEVRRYYDHLMEHLIWARSWVISSVRGKVHS